MSDDITITFTREELAGIYFLTQLGVISSYVEPSIRRVVLKNDTEEKHQEFDKAHDDFDTTLSYIKSITKDDKIVGGAPALDKIEELRTTLNDIFASENPEESAKESTEE
jgi:hypothetical protein